MQASEYSTPSAMSFPKRSSVLEDSVTTYVLTLSGVHGASRFERLHTFGVCLSLFLKLCQVLYMSRDSLLTKTVPGARMLRV